MTIPATYLRDTTGNAFAQSGVSAGGVVLGVNDTTSIADGNPISYALPLRDNLLGESALRRNTVIEKTGVNNGAYTATVTKGGGTFAYNPTSTQWIMRRHTTQINNSGDNSLLFGGSEGFRTVGHNREKMFGAKVLTAWANKGWTPLGIANQRSNWDASVTGVNTYGILDILSDTYKLTTDNTTDSADTNPGTDAVPGDLLYRNNSLTVKSDNYKARTLT